MLREAAVSAVRKNLTYAVSFREFTVAERDLVGRDCDRLVIHIVNGDRHLKVFGIHILQLLYFCQGVCKTCLFGCHWESSSFNMGRLQDLQSKSNP